ncbi:MAG: N-6 DNA methylase, partial [Planctomycetaceae bacterium]
MPRQDFQTIRSEGGLLPPDLLRRVVDPRSGLPGTRPEDYGLPPGERLNEAITQSWNRMRRHWTEFRNAARNLPDHEPAPGLTNDKFSVPLLRELGFGLLPATPGPEVHGKTYPSNRFFGTTAIHLVGCGLSLDRRAAGVRGATTNPHGLVQEFLNRSPGHLWALVSNGLRFRVLRDNQALSRQSFLEFDLETMFAGEVYSDFVLLWMTAHATRFVPQTDNQPQSCWLEQWTRVAEEDGTRALGALRAGVEQALQILGEAFVSHPRNGALRDALRTQQLSLSDFHGQLLRLVYRLIFLFVAEDRTLDGVSLLHPRDESDTADVARRRYAAHYSTARLRDLAGRIKGTRHGDLWQQFNLLVGALSGDPRFAPMREHLALPTFGSFLWNPHSTRHLNAAPLETPPADGTAASATGVELANADFLEALRHLAFTRQGKVLRPVDYKNLGAEELGGVYESLLALTPQISGDGHRFSFAEFAGNERKTSGSYYTPDSLVQCLLDSALDPVLEAALRNKSGPAAEEALLNLKVCDPAVGSGHFLVGAAHRLARHLARVRAQSAGESEPSPLLYQHALRDVIGRCLYGVDINPMSAELCRVSLWLEALEPGKPLSFLDHHIQVGNSLLGTTPALLQKGIPDDAFTAIEGDVSKIVSALKKSNKTERAEHTQASQKTQKVMFSATGPIKLGNLAAELSRIEQAADDTAAGVAEKERQYAEFVRGTSYQYGRLLADLWCAVFVWKKDDSDLGKLCPTERDFRKVEVHAAAGLLPHVREEVQRLATQYQFFHWHLAFPEVFRLPIDG